ncbi:uncharacterized protein EI90DRAFT_3132971 [Cantharellus anzutake]|uniref:uncharacterized protein n=1 Tax=Cantharellus anzutake TaxID=1750568 RepID=UPI0019047739|nr:uncharacterized protein EI90DRAFT_3132971 [Cantharellus anzutake]KAF8318871.1 hypothetical protein EI90DRAFT_3132971 [Cantharellus anzutake]
MEITNTSGEELEDSSDKKPEDNSGDSGASSVEVEDPYEGPQYSHNSEGEEVNIGTIRMVRCNSGSANGSLHKSIGWRSAGSSPAITPTPFFPLSPLPLGIMGRDSGSARRAITQLTSFSLSPLPLRGTRRDSGNARLPSPQNFHFSPLPLQPTAPPPHVFIEHMSWKPLNTLGCHPKH